MTIMDDGDEIFEGDDFFEGNDNFEDDDIFKGALLGGWQHL